MRPGSNLYSLVQPELIGLPAHIPRHMFSLGHVVRIDAQVHDIRKSFVRLKNFTFTGDVPQALLNVSFGKYIEILRPSIRDDASINTRLLGALDFPEILHIQAVAVFRWRDGQAAYFELVSAA